ncbi:hypothetical protein E6P09_00070 [Haloferax mediterranei ATCC 33500]|uniref:DUF5666 domain-containing protein n=1 Tax=Haloferax mediterranei (strain ATCC 33500 / DSM 1411 / JCM 8866 / NBRC 14739 / NCIMB 2177 / R-4) TaxID=523841 RepID=A0A4P8PAB8_HALMT|nr:hypothetical protein E6P09_00070 [Haloferax mediterranei ATCC 33500]
MSRFHVRHSRRLIEGTPRRRVCDLADVTRATVVGRVVEVAGDGPAVKTWREGGAEGETKSKPVVGRTTRPFTVGDETGTVRVRVPPDGHIVAADGHGTVSRCDPPVVLDCGDTVSVTGHVVRGRGTDRLLTGPRFVIAVL